MDKKRLIDLTKSDLLKSQVWEHWTEGQIEYIKPSDKDAISENSQISYITLTDFKLNNGTKLSGFCSPQDASGIDYIQPVILTENGPVKFWQDMGWTENDKDKELKKLDLIWKDVFPVKYKSLIKSDSVYLEGTILDFNTE